LTEQTQTKKVLARGILSHLSAKIVFFSCNFITNITIARWLGVNDFGTFGIIMAINAILTNIVYNGGVETVSKFTAEYPDRRDSIFKASIKIQTLFSLAIFLLYFLSAELIAANLGNSELRIYIMISSVSILLWGISASFIGILGGMRKFGRQAFVPGLNAVLKLALILIFVFLGYGLTGAVFGYVISLIPGVFLARYFCLKELAEENGNFSYKKIINFALPLIAINLLYTLIISLDLLLLQRILMDSEQTGLYASASTMAKSLWILFAAFWTTLLPSISRSIAEKDVELTRRYIRQSLRYLAMLIIPIAFLLSGAAKGIIRMFYTSKFIEAAGPFSVLVFGMVLFTVFTLLNTIITGSGKPNVSLLFGIIGLIFAFVLNKIMIPDYGLMGAAIASTNAFMVVAIIASIYVYNKFKTFISPFSLIKITASSVIIWLIAIKFPMTGVKLILEIFALCGVYVMLLFAFKEIKREDLQILGNMMGR
jgi:O-antigen/teichoic acid export membrane protein